jgi:DNA-binding PadR family transcriptional regulator
MVKQLLLLGILMDGKMHGYQLNEYVKHAMNLYTDLKKSTAYFVLGKLEKEKYVSHQVEREGKRPERRVYQITKEGKLYFQELLRKCIRGYTPATLNDDIGIAFLDRLEVSEAKELLESKRQKIKDQLKKFDDIGDHGSNLRYAIDHSAAYLKADLKWVNSILETIGKEIK